MNGSTSNICKECLKHTGIDDVPCAGEGCKICLGLWQSHQILEQKLQEACQPYGGSGSNYFARNEPIQIVLPGDIILRYDAAAINSKNASSSTQFQQALKSHLRTILSNYAASNQKKEINSNDFPECVSKEEQGYLAIHLLVTPYKDISRPIDLNFKKNKERRKRRRFHGPTDTQTGGDALINRQEIILRESPLEFLSIAEVERTLEDQSDNRERLSIWFSELSASTSTSELHVIVNRRPIYVRSMYTKSRRDVSQSPFYVTDKNSGKLVKLGITSVEEQIVPPLEKVLGGVSKINNNNSAGLVLGRIKFHASGREDMNVRMILPPPNTSSPNCVGGRPFVCQAIDVLRLPSATQLLSVAQNINNSDSSEVSQNQEDVLDRLYGNNPMGVGICSKLTFCPAKDFSNLQADTESKVKYYGCHCWSKAVLPSNDELQMKLGSSLPIKLQQRTPVRVLHRRPNIIRDRYILSLKCTRLDDHNFQLHLSTSAGTYVKEFVHGDLGRTKPSVAGLLGTTTDILQLDCEGIQLS
mmetsp:Transcript_4395/g.6818  ORF Transcript_4395/g.6818 Transcript_4395/m.6818 type:complete len:528 (+) Transcript_4395:266-1849(+)